MMLSNTLATHPRDSFEGSHRTAGAMGQLISAAELFVGGAGVAHAYLVRDELIRERVMADSSGAADEVRA